MCCRVSLTPSPPIEALVLLLPMAGMAQFGESVGSWSRAFEAEQTTVRLAYRTTHIEVSLTPAVTNYQQHADKRLAASYMMEIAALLGERFGGQVEQLANVAGCMADGRKATEVIAVYPESPLAFESLCLGWRETLMPAERQ